MEKKSEEKTIRDFVKLWLKISSDDPMKQAVYHSWRDEEKERKEWITRMYQQRGVRTEH